MDETVIKKIQPNNVDAEQSVIGCMLMNRNAIVDVADILTKDDFYHSQYGALFEAMITLYNEGKAIDVLTVSNKLKEMGLPDEISNMSYIVEIASAVTVTVHAKEYAHIVQDAAIRRKLIRFGEQMTEACYLGKSSVEDVLEQSEKQLFDIAQNRNGGEEFVPMQDIVLNVLDTIEENAKRGSKITGVPTGFIDLDEKLTGLHGSELILIAARPAMGKTAFALNIAQNAAMKSRIPCAIFSLEMSKEQLATRLIAMDSMVDSQAIRTGQLADDDWSELMDSTYKVGSSPMFIDDTPGISITELRSKCRKYKLENDLGLVIIDYLQLMTGGSKKQESRQQEISEISRSLKALAREINAPVIALSQLSRACETRPDHRPMLSDLRESGAIEQDADVVMFLYRDDYYNKDTDKKNISEVIIAKQRNGPIGTVELVWLPNYTKFANKEK